MLSLPEFCRSFLPESFRSSPRFFYFVTSGVEVGAEVGVVVPAGAFSFVSFGVFSIVSSFQSILRLAVFFCVSVARFVAVPLRLL